MIGGIEFAVSTMGDSTRHEHVVAQDGTSMGAERRRWAMGEVVEEEEEDDDDDDDDGDGGRRRSGSESTRTTTARTATTTTTTMTVGSGSAGRGIEGFHVLYLLLPLLPPSLPLTSTVQYWGIELPVYSMRSIPINSPAS
jgi:hypothetical protein